MNPYFIFFFLSGFCSVLYELIWLRLAMAQFGVTTAMVSIVLSVFMAGLGLGSWVGGRVAAPKRGSGFAALRLYAGIELLIGISSLIVPRCFGWGRTLLEHYGPTSSAEYYCAAGLWVALTLIPWCGLMGATLPIGMRAIAQTIPAESRRSFSYLYMANVAGAVVGTDLPLFLIELLGFRGTLRIGAVCNGLIAISAFVLAMKRPPILQPTEDMTPAMAGLASEGPTDWKTLGLLFLSGLTCMGMEVAWVRSYTPYFGTVVYAFASLLGVYLLATFLGSAVYRRWSIYRVSEPRLIWTLLATCAVVPVIATSPIVHMSPMQRLVIGISPFTGLLGFLTPLLVDRFSLGRPDRAGLAYATNVAGCILGPLLAGFGLLPFLSERWTLVLLSLPWLIVGAATLRASQNHQRYTAFGLWAVAAVLVAAGRGYEDAYPGSQVRRDSTATVIAAGSGMEKELLVNGFGMTNLTPITKVMAHLPLASLDRSPQNALVICFGMGTTFRSLRSWDIPVTAVELVPSVPKLFGYYHADAATILASPLSHVVIDDGRRYLERTPDSYDVITIDPPPPLQAAGSSLLYSREFYEVARQRLRPGGILQQWIPTSSEEDAVDVAAVARSLRDSFPYVRAFPEEFGIHFLASDRPIVAQSAEHLAQKMPAAAATDFVEWDPPSPDGARGGAEDRFSDLLKGELTVDSLIAKSPVTPALTDDRPVNEYYVLRARFGAH